MPETFNIASYLPRMADEAPDRPALYITRSRNRAGKAIYASMTFAELEARSNRCANGISSAGIERGMRVLVMVRPGFEFIELIFALFKMGAVPVMIDPGMGVGRMLECIRQVDPQAFIGIPLAHAMRVLRPGPFKTVQHVVTVGWRWFWGGPTLARLRDEASPDFDAVATAADETAAILFTSGSTGPAKGVVYEHGMFDAQVRMIQKHYGIEPGEIDLPTFPLFALFAPALGMSCVIPDMDPTRPAHVDPAKIVEAIHDHQVTNTFGSPALWKRVGHYCVERDIKLPTLRRVLIAGAPVPWKVIEDLHQVLDSAADVHTPYGATESLPVASIPGREITGAISELTRRGAGTCVGKPLPDVDMRFIRITDEPIAEWSADLVVPDGEVGEIVVSGPMVTKEYYGLPDATALAKIHDGGRIWHRMGDLGYRDGDGRIWFCGRKAHRVVTESGTLFSVRCEAVFNEHPEVARSALVGTGPRARQVPVIIVEPEVASFPGAQRVPSFREELLDLGRANGLTSAIETVLFHPSLPVDIRHNVKINREALAEWARRRLR
ncbi:MAG: AMP-binding protein [Phycisphaerales bacterium]|nr:MAG: AMP-binding protein [Phycisphaerales bacterium]